VARRGAQVGTCTPNVDADVVLNGFMAFAPNLDFFGANVYGFASTGYVAKVASIIAATGWTKPYLAARSPSTPCPAPCSALPRDEGSGVSGPAALPA